MDLSKQVFYSICYNDLHTRKEIAEKLGVSNVSVGKAVDTLISRDLISAQGKISGLVGRKSEFLDVSDKNSVLLIDLTEDDFSFSFSTLSIDSIAPIKLEYVSSMDFEGNLSLLLSNARSRIPTEPCCVFVAVPGIPIDGKLIDTHVKDYPMSSIIDAVSKHFNAQTHIVSGAVAVDSHYGEYQSDTLFVHIGRYVWGGFNGRYPKDISKIKVGGAIPLTYSDALMCTAEASKMADYTTRFIDNLDAVLSPNTIFISSDRFSSEELSIICSRNLKLHIAPSPSPVFCGLMRLCTDTIFEKNILNKTQKSTCSFHQSVV